MITTIPESTSIASDTNAATGLAISADLEPVFFEKTHRTGNKFYFLEYF
jgi:hypothetical protein